MSGDVRAAAAGRRARSRAITWLAGPAMLLLSPSLSAQGDGTQWVLVDQPGDLENVDAQVERLELFVDAPADLAPIGRIECLRHLRLQVRLVEPGTRQLGTGWAEAGPDALAALKQCAALQSLSVGYFTGFDPACLRVIGSLPALERLELIGGEHLVDRRLVGVLNKLALRRLRLTGVRVAPDALPALCELPLLEELELDVALHLVPDDLACLGRLRHCRRLSLRRLGHVACVALEAQCPLPDDQPGGGEEDLPPRGGGPGVHETRAVLTGAAMRAIATLPELRELDLCGSVVSDDVMSDLPTALTKLDIGGVTGLTADGVAGLTRLAALRQLAFDTPGGGVAGDVLTAAFAGALPLLELTDVYARSGVSPALSAALAKCRTLSRVRLEFGRGHPREYAFVAALPALERVTVRGLAPTELSRLRELVAPAVEVVGE